jgi:hypothetical protein
MMEQVQTYYLIANEGHTEYIIFSYLTKVKFKNLFDKSKIKFSDKIEIAEDKIQISKGKLNGISSLKSFEIKNKLIKDKYSEQKIFFILDEDLFHSNQIGKTIKKQGDIIQFIKYNSEYLLLKLNGKTPKVPKDFNNLQEFRDYCKEKFRNEFGKKVSQLKTPDLDNIFNKIADRDIIKEFSELFSTTE